MKIVTQTNKIPLDYAKLGLIKDSKDAYYDAFILKSEPLELHQKHPCIVVCPGGAYKGTAPREAEHIATQFIAKGFSAYILRYSCDEAKFPCALTELSWLIKHIRDNAEENHIDPDRIAVIGFSAGGHLVGSLGAYWNDPEIQKLAGVSGEENKPNGLILGYPVITGGEFAHKGSLKNLFGADKAEDPDIIEKFSIEKHITPTFPATFIWHTASDAGVPVENSLLLAMSLSHEHIPFELKVYPYGPHGLALANWQTSEGKENLLMPRAEGWVQEAISFVTDIAFCAK